MSLFSGSQLFLSVDWSSWAQLMFIFCFRFSVVLFDRQGISSSHATNLYLSSLRFNFNVVLNRDLVRRGFLFLLVLGMGCVILLWHSLCLPYNHLFVKKGSFFFTITLTADQIKVVFLLHSNAIKYADVMNDSAEPKQTRSSLIWISTV